MTSHERDVTAWVQGELSVTDAAAFERELARSPALRARVHDEQRMLASLGAMDDADWNDARRTPTFAPWISVASWAAAALLAITLMIDTSPPNPPATPVVNATIVPPDTAEVARLLRRSSTSALGAREVGLRSLGLIALARSGDVTDTQSVREAATWLLDHQGADGTIGLTPRAADHAVATVALLEAAEHVEISSESLDRAVDVLRREARSARRFGAHVVDDAWSLQALLLARAGGRTDCEMSIDALHRSLREQRPGAVGSMPQLAEVQRLCVPRRSRGAGSDELLDVSQRILATLSPPGFSSFP